MQHTKTVICSINISSFLNVLRLLLNHLSRFIFFSSMSFCLVDGAECIKFTQTVKYRVLSIRQTFIRLVNIKLFEVCLRTFLTAFYEHL